LLVAAIGVATANQRAANRGAEMPDPKPEQAEVTYNPTESGETSEIAGVLRRHQAALLARPGVTGVAVGKSPIGDPAVVIYVLDKTYRTGLPSTVDGHPVVVEATGPINALEK